MENTKKDEGRDRRRAKRVFASFVEYCRVEDEALKRFQAFTENISATGICIFVNEAIEAGAYLSITVYLLDGTNPIETRGKVMWWRPSVFLSSGERKHYDIGVEFVGLPKEDQDRLTQYAAKYPSEETSPEKKFIRNLPDGK